MRMKLFLTLAVALIALLPASSARAQATQQTGRTPESGATGNAALAEARKLVAAGDSASAVKLLRSATARDPDNGPLWFEYGALLSAQTRYAWRRGIMPPGAPQLIIAAESSLARATRLAPDSFHYAVAYARHLFGTNVSSMNRAMNVQQSVVRQLESSDSLAAAGSADHIGIMQWRRFETLIGRGAPTWNSFGNSERLNRQNLVRYVAENFRAPPVMYGLALYTDALDYFRYASATDPDNEMYFRHEMMVLAEGRRWNEMGNAAQQRMRERPAQPWPWLVFGLAEHRQGRMRAAQAAFDSGFARLPEADRERLQSIGRLLPIPRTKWYDSLSADGKKTLDELYWNTANPSLLLPTNPLLAEFRARVVYSEMRFTDDEKGIPGASSDKAAIYIRYGPPDAILEGIWNANQGSNIRFDYSQTWFYFKDVMTFAFGQNRGYGSAFQTSGSKTTFDSIAISRPASWSDLPMLGYRVDSIHTQVARFRGQGDSIDVALFSAFRPGALRRNAPMDTSVIQHGVFMVDALGRVVTKVTDTMKSNERDTMHVEPRTFVVRTTLQSSAVRIEALEPDLMQAARTVADISGFTTHGFGTSDLLIAEKVGPEVSQGNGRWTGYAIAPFIGGKVTRGTPIGLLWETYEPASRNGSGKLKVTIAIQKETEKGLVALGGRVIGGLREAVSGNRTFDRVGVAYEREFPSAPVVVDHIMVELGRLDPGRYRVTLTVTDLIGGQSVNRTQLFTIAP